jgi:predicted  nucleic acid-binding Zn-ribbon protein
MTLAIALEWFSIVGAVAAVLGVGVQVRNFLRDSREARAKRDRDLIENATGPLHAQIAQVVKSAAEDMARTENQYRSALAEKDSSYRAALAEKDRDIERAERDRDYWRTRADQMENRTRGREH